MSSASRDARELHNWLVARGWELVKVANHSLYRFPPNGATTRIAGTPSDWRGGLNKRAQVKRLERGQSH